ncbi:hypothetical protein JVX90_14025 [Gordonia sp. PDNC005]|uniref:hypothetical protein n=1 Tax=unclassified Gordonia (in: high G+C Gram-positive bacteria) TaxID=2657482 RepID=UPI00196646A2|nr:hypothetical protein [Gordonia sp. PDNC005]QRY61527.1 hypothetical protein JVX90_14025 [Gordonia sp. PDNC005]
MPHAVRSAPRRIAWWLVGAVAAAVLIVGAFALAKPSPPAALTDRELIEEQVRGYVNDLSRGAFIAAVGRSCSATPSARSAVAEPTGDVVVPSTAIINDVTITGSSAVVDAVLDTRGVRTDLPMRLEKHNDGWCIADLPGR